MSGQRRDPARTSRRAVLAGAVAGLVLTSLPELPNRNGLIARIRALLSGAHSARSADRAIAYAIVFGSVPATSPVEQLTDVEISARIRNNIAADYRNGRLVDLHGWRIAQTESQALALLCQAARA